MKPFLIAALVLVACAAGFAGSMIHEATNVAEDVHAAPPRATQPIRIALVNLEEASKQSKKFKTLKNDWDNAQGELKKQADKYEQTYREEAGEVQRLRLAGGDEDEIMTKRVELQALEQTMKAADEEGKKYLSALLQQYQKDVLVVVMAAIEEYCKLEGYDIVLQDYSVEGDDADFFSGGAYAQSIMSKPVLAAPGMKANTNSYVIDITQAIINKVK